jgi:hypothetical protein
MDRNPHQTWLITYGASGPVITYTMLENDCRLVPEECYTVIGRDFKYTLIKLSRSNRARVSAMEKVLDIIQEKHGIIKNQIFGFDSVAINTRGGDQVEDHPGFKLMVQEMNNESEIFQWWICSGDLKTYKAGLLWKFRTDIEPEDMSRGFLIQKVRDITEKNKLLFKDKSELDTLVQALQQENLRLEVENKKLDSRVGHLENRVKRQLEIIYRLDPDNHLVSRRNTEPGTLSP